MLLINLALKSIQYFAFSLFDAWTYHYDYNANVTIISFSKTYIKFYPNTGGNDVRGNRTVMQMKSLRDHPNMNYGSNKQ